MRKIIVNEKYNNKKLDNFVFSQFPNLNKNAFFKALRNKDIRINDKKVNENVYIHTGEEISIYIVDIVLAGLTNIDIIYEDDNILVLNKPTGVPVDDNSSSQITFTQIIKSKFGKALEPCHRLDQNTSGIIIYAKTPTSLEIMLDKFKNDEIEKHYLALVIGKLNKKHELLEAYLFKDSRKSQVYISNTPKTGYSKIITEYTVLSENAKNNTSVLDICIHTGKTHQIRAHLAHIGHPIIGDGKYGINEINKKFNKSTQMLVSYRVKFNFKNFGTELDYLNGKELKIEASF